MNPIPTLDEWLAIKWGMVPATPEEADTMRGLETVYSVNGEFTWDDDTESYRFDRS